MTRKQRKSAARRDSVWLNTDIRKAPELDALDAAAFGVWTRLPFLVEIAGDDHIAPDVDVIAADWGLPTAGTAQHMTELTAAGFVEPLPDGRFRMTDLSRRFYTLTWEEARARGDNEIDDNE